MNLHPNRPPASSSVRRPRRTPQQWAELVAQQAASDLDVAAFCRQHDVGLSGFYAWRRRLADAEPAPDAANPTADPPRFLRLEPAAASDTPPAPVTARFPGGVTLTLGVDALAPLVLALRQNHTPAEASAC